MKKIFIILCVYGLITCSGFFHHQNVLQKVEDVNRINDQKNFISYVVQKDDTLWDLAVEYAEPEYTSINNYIREVMKSNHLEDATIRQGQLLILPCYELPNNMLADL